MLPIAPINVQAIDLIYRLGASETPTSLLLLSSFITGIDQTFDSIGSRVLSSWKVICLLVVCLVSSYYIVAVIAFEPLLETFYFWITPATFIINCFQHLEASHVLVIVIGYLTLVFFCWKPEHSTIFQVK